MSGLGRECGECAQVHYEYEPPVITLCHTRVNDAASLHRYTIATSQSAASGPAFISAATSCWMGMLAGPYGYADRTSSEGTSTGQSGSLKLCRTRSRVTPEVRDSWLVLATSKYTDG